jgi:hypothetical protein
VSEEDKMKATVMGEVLLLVGLLAVAWLVYVQQAQMVELELELDKIRGALAGGNSTAEAKPKAAPKPRPKPRPEAQA